MPDYYIDKDGKPVIFTEEEIEDARAILRLFDNALYIRRTSYGNDTVLYIETSGLFPLRVNGKRFPSLKAGATVDLAEIVREAE